jgi:GT2 family glycosyltransferase
MMNPVLLLTHNCLELTKKCVDSIVAQDIPTEIMVIDNGSTDGTREWFNENLDVDGFLWPDNHGVSTGWNYGLHTLFSEHDCDQVLVLNNDIVIPTHFYRTLLETNEGFITGRSVEPGSELFWSCGKEQPRDMEKAPHPDFSAFLIRRSVWETVGPFDENMKLYASDCDYHVRMHKAGIWAGSIPLHFEHYRSSTLNNASREEQQEIRIQADRNRQAFRAKWGCSVGTPEYEQLFR